MPQVVVVSLVLSPVIYLSGRWRAITTRLCALFGLAVLWLTFGLTMRDYNALGSLTYTRGTVSFYFDGLSLLITAVVLSLSTLVICFSGADIRGKVGEEKYYAMLILMTGAVIGLVSAGDLFNLWVWFELTAIASYSLVAFYRDERDALAACVKYLVQVATGSILVLFGIALVLMQSGTLDLAAIRLTVSPLTIAAGTLLLIGFGVKIAFVPTYTWLPDAYAQAPSGISALLGGVVTISGLAALLRVLALFELPATSWGAALIAFGTLNILIGNLLALAQDQVKRIFAYSSISHIGFMLLAVGIGIYAEQRIGFHAGMLHLLIHALMKALAFLAVGAVIYILNQGTSPLRIKDLAGVAKQQPLLAAALVIASLSLAGVPPLSGFISKWLIFSAGIQSGSATIILLTVFAALNSVFSLAYYLPILNALFRAEPTASERALPFSMALPICLLTVAVILIGIFPSLVDSLVLPAAEALTAVFGG